MKVLWGHSDGLPAWIPAVISAALALAPGPGVGRGSQRATIPEKIIAGAREQLSWGTRYDGSYVRIKYPGGDVPKTQGVCTDVIVRAFRHAGYDLQKLIHEDKKRATGAYPKYPGQRGNDTNIDHRRVPNQAAFFKRHGRSLSKVVSKATIKDWKPGDVVMWKLDSGLDHTGILTDKRNAAGWPFVIHNLSTPLEEDCLAAWKITGHFRYPK